MPSTFSSTENKQNTKRQNTRVRKYHLKKTTATCLFQQIDGCLTCKGHGRNGQGRSSIGAHGVAVGQGVVGGDLAKDKRVRNERTEEIHRVHLKRRE